MLKLDFIPLEQIKPYLNNPRKHPEEQIKKIAQSILEFGFKVPIIVDKNFIIIAGHGRYEAAKRLNLKRVPVIIADDLTPEQVKAFRIADNRISLESEWDLDALAAEIQELLEEDFDLSLTMLNEKELDYFLTAFSMKQADTKTKEGKGDKGEGSEGEENFDPYKLWEGMTEYISENKEPYRKLIVNFPDERAVEEFARITGLHITKGTKSVWFPPKEELDRKNYHYEIVETEGASNEEGEEEA